MQTAREYTNHSNTAVSLHIDILDRYKRLTSNNYENAILKKQVLLSTESNTPVTITNMNCTVISISATNISELASILAPILSLGIISLLN